MSLARSHLDIKYIKHIKLAKIENNTLQIPIFEP
jgi:hypothetical protein